ncbi:hypothetical protein AB0J83_03455 [Actinoplanes sp. NPDC049596]|uniref:hypothetical protein n=1 Tax=unclassified Actinoplanes TaxID=2626549 RepID=UPI003413CA36
MASESCPICGEDADADELDPHGHFSKNDGYDEEDLAEQVVVHLLILGRRRDRTACGEDIDNSNDGASTGESSVNCPKCRAVM